MEYKDFDINKNNVKEDVWNTENWFNTPGDLDDFVFYGSMNKTHSER